jgi:hypothetical protein
VGFCLDRIGCLADYFIDRELSSDQGCTDEPGEEFKVGVAV